MEQNEFATVTWEDPVTAARGYLVIHNIVSGLATGGCRMRKGLTLPEVQGLARGMARKAALFDIPVGGAKGGIDYDPKAADAKGVLRRFMSAMRDYLDNYWVTAEDLGVPQHLLDEVFEELGLGQSYHAAICRAEDPEATLQRVRDGLNARLPGGHLLGDVAGGYGVAQSCLGVLAARGWEPEQTTIAVQGVGTMGGGTALYLHEAGCRITTLADASGALYAPEGLDVPSLLQHRNAYGEIEREHVPANVQLLERGEVLRAEVDILVPAAVSYVITQENAHEVQAKVVVEAANMATLPEAEQLLFQRNIPVIPDFMASAGAMAWAWWLLLGRINSVPALSFEVLRTEMQSRVAPLITTWDNDRLMPRAVALEQADQTIDLRIATQQHEVGMVAIP